jgi:hypothetical protein
MHIFPNQNDSRAIVYNGFQELNTGELNHFTLQFFQEHGAQIKSCLRRSVRSLIGSNLTELRYHRILSHRALHRVALASFRGILTHPSRHGQSRNPRITLG